MSDCQALGCDKPTVNGTTCERHSERCFVAGCEEVYDWGSGGLCSDHLSAAVAMFLANEKCLKTNCAAQAIPGKGWCEECARRTFEQARDESEIQARRDLEANAEKFRRGE